MVDVSYDEPGDIGYVPAGRRIKAPATIRVLKELGQRLAESHQEESQIFYGQAKFAEDYRLVQDVSVSFANLEWVKCPTYRHMSERQLIKYFDFRTRFRAGQRTEVPEYLWYLLSFELIQGIGAVDALDGYEQLCRLRDWYGPRSEDFAVNVRRLIHDYAIYWGLDPTLVDERSNGDLPFSVEVFHAAVHVLNDLPDGRWPDEGEDAATSLPDAEDLLTAFFVLADLPDESTFITRHRGEVARVCCGVFARVVRRERNRKQSFVRLCFTTPRKLSYRMFPDAPFDPPESHEDGEVKTGVILRYLCEGGKWYRVWPVRRKKVRALCADIVSAVDAKMRRATAYPEQMDAPVVTGYLAQFVDEEVDAYLARRSLPSEGEDGLLVETGATPYGGFVVSELIRQLKGDGADGHVGRAEPQDVVLTEALRDLRDAASGFVLKETVFYKQARMAADFTGRFEDNGTEIHITDACPTYREMTDYQLLRYFDFRTRFREGEQPVVPAAFIKTLAFELINGIGWTDARDGYEQLSRLCELSAGISCGLARDLKRWTHDFIVYWGLDLALLDTGPHEAENAAARLAFEAEHRLLRLGLDRWPPVSAGTHKDLPSSTDLFDALSKLSTYRADQSSFFQERHLDAARVCSRVFARMVAHCHTHRKFDYCEGLFAALKSRRRTYALFPKVPFYESRNHENVVVQGFMEVYVCEWGKWSHMLPIGEHDKSAELGGLLYLIDCKMREATGYPQKLKEQPISSVEKGIVEEEMAAHFSDLAAIEAAKVKIDRSSLAGIRSSSIRTREALLTDEERGIEADVAGTASVREETTVEGAEPVGGHANKPDTAPAMHNGLALTDMQVALVRRFLAGERVSEADAPFLSLEIDAINEVFLDIVGDTVIEYADDGYELVEDYVHDVREALG